MEAEGPGLEPRPLTCWWVSLATFPRWPQNMGHNPYVRHPAKTPPHTTPDTQCNRSHAPTAILAQLPAHHLPQELTCVCC
jgi:hypothetical protein